MPTSSWPTGPSDRRHHWTTLLHARAIENQAYVVGVNRVGEGDGLVYQGTAGWWIPGARPSPPPRAGRP